MSSAVSHTPRTTGGAESTSLATESYQLLIVTGLTSNTQEAVLQTTALQVIFEFADNIVREEPALL